MRWFSGSIAEAISSAQSQKKVFVAYIEGTCSKAKTMASVLNDNEVSMEIENAGFVCVKLEFFSVGYKQLVEIYWSVPVPSLFFISHHGHVLDIVDGNLFEDYADFKEIIIKAVDNSRNRNNNDVPPTPVPADKLIETRREQVEKLLLSKKMIAENRKKNLQKKEEAGTSAQSPGQSSGEPEQSRRAQVDAELKKMAEEREKERRDEARAKQKILDQIAQDRAERAKKSNEARPSNSSAPMTSTVKPTPAKVEISQKASEAKPSTSSVNNAEKPLPVSTDARLQFKLPTGESKSNVFPKSTKLASIRDYIDNNLELTSRNYQLATTFPRREFTPEDNTRTLEELNLVPTAVLLILYSSSGKMNPLTGSWFDMVAGLVRSFLSPLYSAATYVRGMLFSGGRSEDSGSASQPSSGPAPTSSNRRQPPLGFVPLLILTLSCLNWKTYVRKSGNVHTLGQLKDGDDENNTWNGNSTQQM